MWKIIIGVVIWGISVPAGAVDFLGVELCRDSVSTSVSLPTDSPLKIQSVEIGKHGALVMLLEGRGGGTLDRVDDLMTGYTGSRGSGDSKQLQWSGNGLTGVAQLLKNGQVALVVSSTDDCTRADAGIQEPQSISAAATPAPLADGAAIRSSEVPATPTRATHDGGLAASTAAIAAASALPQEDPLPARTDVALTEGFQLRGNLEHHVAVDGWIDVMGVVTNNTGSDYRLATFDLAFFDETGDLICVDTISVTQLKGGRSRAFRDSMECPEYEADSVASSELQFAGGY